MEGLYVEPMGTFYSDFDRECLHDAFNPARTMDFRSVFHQDRDRVLFTPSFRRLQSKTQVFQSGEYDFYRTRLTHSLEVANIAKSIAVWLRRLHPEIELDADLIEAVCLAHDIGHPPFGHNGERILNKMMSPYGGFEGNAQSVRMLTRTVYSRTTQRGGMSPSRALLDGILKYKRLYKDRGASDNHFLYDDQEDLLVFCYGTNDLGDEPNKVKSLECQIMDLADDIAYSCFDLVDGAQARFITTDRMVQWGAENELDSDVRSHFSALVEMVRINRIVPRISRVVGDLIQSVGAERVKGPVANLSQRHAWRLAVAGNAEKRIALHKRLCSDLVYGSSALRQIEFKGTHLLQSLGGALFDNYLGNGKEMMLLPTSVHRQILASSDAALRARLVCDYVSGMTDAYAVRSYKRLFDPNYGSISELI